MGQNIVSIHQEISAGGVVCSKDKKIVIGRHSGYGKWVLPKGLVEQGESEEETAIREVEEEVGVKAKIVNKIKPVVIEYDYVAELEVQTGKSANGELSERRVKKYQEDGGKGVKIHKRVKFYLMELKGELDSCGWEMSERKWMSVDEALKKLAFESEREVVRKLCL